MKQLRIFLLLFILSFTGSAYGAAVPDECTVSNAAAFTGRLEMAVKHTATFFATYPSCKDAGERPLIGVLGTIELSQGLSFSNANGVHVQSADFNQPATLNFKALPGMTCGTLSDAVIAICLSGQNHVIEHLHLNYSFSTAVVLTGTKNVFFKNQLDGYGAAIDLRNLDNNVQANIIQNSGASAFFFPKNTTPTTVDDVLGCNAAHTEGGPVSNAPPTGWWIDPISYLDEQEGQRLYEEYYACHRAWQSKEMFDNTPAAGGGDGEGGGTATDTDTDDDGVPDVADNCPNITNTDQADTFGTTAGDACEAIADPDLCAGKVVLSDGSCPCNTGEIYNPAGNVCLADVDTDGDGIIDGADKCPATADPSNACTGTATPSVTPTKQNNNQPSADGGEGCSIVTDATLPTSFYGLLTILVVTAALAITRQFRRRG